MQYTQYTITDESNEIVDDDDDGPDYDSDGSHSEDSE